MLGRDHVHRVERGEGVVDEHVRPPRGERGADVGAAGTLGRAASSSRGVDRVGDVGVPRDEDGGAAGTVLGLGQQVGGGELVPGTLASATTTTSDGPASESMPTTPATSRLAAAT